MHDPRQSDASPHRAHRYAFGRLRHIVQEIGSGAYPTKDDLARIVGRGKRTVQRDLETLRNEYSAPIEFDRIRNGFYLADPGWRLPRLTLSEGELLGFFAAEQIIRRLGATPEVDLARNALRRLATLLPENVVVDLSAAADAIEFAPPSGLVASPETLRRLVSAANRRETLSILYRSRHSGTERWRDVDVLLIYCHLGEYYAICRSPEYAEPRDFHAGRILDLRETGRMFEPPADWDREAYLRQGFGMFRGGASVRVVVVFDVSEAPYARERMIHPTETRIELPDGRLRVEFDTTEAALEQVTRWALQYGEHVVVERPAELRRMLRKQLERALAQYEET